MSGTGTGFDSSPIKGEGDSVGCVGLFTRVTRRPSGLRIKPAMTVWWDCLAITLCSQCQALGQALTLSRQGRGGLTVGLDLFSPSPALWIDESPITLCQRVRFQRKGVNALSFSSRKRPAYAGMTVLVLSCSPSPLIPLPSRERGIWWLFCKGLVNACRISHIHKTFDST